jgi:hypothetical protein
MVLGVAAAFLRRQRTLAIVALGGAFLLLTGATFLRVQSSRRDPEKAATAVAVETTPRRSPLLALRRALAAGAADVEPLAKSADRAQGRGELVDLWVAQMRVQQTDLAGARTILARFPPPAQIPLAEILRGRIALMENDESTAALSFRHAVSLGPGRDGLWMEAAGSLLALGSEERVIRELERLARIGSRDADVYYGLAAFAAMGGKDAEAESALHQAWSMRPVTRAAVIGQGEFWGVLRRPGVTEWIGLGAASDPLVDAPDASSKPIALPPLASAERCGGFLRIHVGSQNLFVPGGAALAPSGTPVVDATAWDRQDERQALDDFDRLLAGGHGTAAYAQPALRRRLSDTLTALANHNRWSDILRLTDGVTAASEFVPTSVIALRITALDRSARGGEAMRLLVETAGSKALQRKRDARANREIAEMLAAHDQFDAAVALYNRAQQINANPFVDDRVRQIEMNKRLEHRYDTYATPHFQIHYASEAGPDAARKLGSVLEREFQRLQVWIPTPTFRPVVVNALTWEDFRSTYTGSDFILGFYNGKITVPVVGVDTEIPVITNILAHELSHAMIAQATNDQAPHWFQEGLAQRIEERDYHANAFNMFDDSRLLPVSLLDDVLNAPDPELVSAAYIVAQTDIRYIEAKYGRAGIQQMLRSFADGATTSDAVAQLSGLPLPEFEKHLREWGRSESGVFDNRKAASRTHP